MSTLSVVIPAHNNSTVILDAVRSVERAVGLYRRETPAHRVWGCEVVVVDDGSQDETYRVVAEHARGRDGFTVVRRPTSSNAACARNTGVAAARGDILFFLDGDDRFLDRHVLVCCRALEDPAVAFVKTGVALDDPVHPEWEARIENSLVINLAVRRRCHEAAGGFPDLHVFRRSGDLFFHDVDAFRAVEDVYYNDTLAQVFKGVRAEEKTVQYTRSPGNAFDRQYEKFQSPPGQFREELSEERRFQLRLTNLLHQRHLASLRERMQGGAGGGVPGGQGVDGEPA